MVSVMYFKIGKFSVLVLFIALCLCDSVVAEAQVVYRKTAFKDEFNKPLNTPIDTGKWTAEIGGKGWGNQELQYYTNSIGNAYHDGNGSLVIKLIELEPPLTLSCWYGPCKYTSARLVTKKKFEQKYGRMEARIKVPSGRGFWPAFWMLGSDIGQNGWPDCGEIDIMENIGREPATVHGTIHGPGYSGANGIGSSFTLPDGEAFSDKFHVFAVEWSEEKIIWYIDGREFQTLTPEDLPENSEWVFDHPFFLIMNLAIGGPWSGNPDESTVFPGVMMIDYVRVYKR
jgi:beta-glucanase (GH16 family)